MEEKRITGAAEERELQLQRKKREKETKQHREVEKLFPEIIDWEKKS